MKQIQSILVGLCLLFCQLLTAQQSDTIEIDEQVVDSVITTVDSTAADESIYLNDEEGIFDGKPAGFSPDSLSQLYKNEKTGKKKFDERLYQRAIQGLDYKEPPQPKKVEKKIIKQEIDTSGKSSFLGIGQVVLIIVILIVLVVLIMLIIKQAKQTNPRLKEDPDWLQVDIEKEASPEQILQQKLEECLRNGNYAFAVRLLYLQTLADLHREKYIRWKKDKTNADYVAELRNTPLFRPFRDLTRWFEKSWYSYTPPDEKTYRKLEPRFMQFRQEIGHNQEGRRE
jgi:cell division protein FtsL